MFYSHRKTNFVSGMLMGIIAGIAAASCTCFCTDTRRMKKIKQLGKSVCKTVTDKLHSAL